MGSALFPGLEVVKSVPNEGAVPLLARPVFPLFFCVSGVCSILFPCFSLSVSVQLIAWKDSSPK